MHEQTSICGIKRKMLLEGVEQSQIKHKKNYKDHVSRSGSDSESSVAKSCLMPPCLLKTNASAVSHNVDISHHKLLAVSADGSDSLLPNNCSVLTSESISLHGCNSSISNMESPAPPIRLKICRVAKTDSSSTLYSVVVPDRTTDSTESLLGILFLTRL